MYILGTKERRRDERKSENRKLVVNFFRSHPRYPHHARSQMTWARINCIRLITGRRTRLQLRRCKILPASSRLGSKRISHVSRSTTQVEKEKKKKCNIPLTRITIGKRVVRYFRWTTFSYDDWFEHRVEVISRNYSNEHVYGISLMLQRVAGSRKITRRKTYIWQKN